MFTGPRERETAGRGFGSLNEGGACLLPPRFEDKRVIGLKSSERRQSGTSTDPGATEFGVSD